MNIYIIWNKKENRPVLCSDLYGAMIVFHTEIQSQAYMASSSNENFEIKKFEI